MNLHSKYFKETTLSALYYSHFCPRTGHFSSGFQLLDSLVNRFLCFHLYAMIPYNWHKNQRVPSMLGEPETNRYFSGKDGFLRGQQKLQFKVCNHIEPWQIHSARRGELFFGHAHNMKKFLGQGLNLNHRNDNNGSLTPRSPGNSKNIFIEKKKKLQ